MDPAGIPISPDRGKPFEPHGTSAPGSSQVPPPPLSKSDRITVIGINSLVQSNAALKSKFKGVPISGDSLQAKKLGFLELVWLLIKNLGGGKELGLRLVQHSLYEHEQAHLAETRAKSLTTFFKDLKKVPHHQELPQFDPKAGPPKIPPVLLVDPTVLYAQKRVSVVENAAKKAQMHTAVDPIPTGVGQILPIGFKDGALKVGLVMPTNEKLIIDDLDKGHLTNVYSLSVNGKNYGVIRSGWIDTKKKADEFLAVLKDLRGKIIADGKKTDPNFEANFKFRILSHQLNSMENESAEIYEQHSWIAYVNGRLKEDNSGEIIHINTPSNVWYEKSKEWWGKLLPGERYSHILNSDSWSTYTGWLADNLQPAGERLEFQSEAFLAQYQAVQKALGSITHHFPMDEVIGNPERLRRNCNALADNIKDFTFRLQFRDPSGAGVPGKLKESYENMETLLPHMKALWGKMACQVERMAIKDLLTNFPCRSGEVEACRKIIQQSLVQIANKEDVKKAQFRLEQAQNAMVQHLMQDYKHLDILQTKLMACLNGELDIGIPLETLKRDFKPILQKVILMKQILGSQLDIPDSSLDRGQEGMAIQLLNSLLGISSTLNCKSGLDRTGLWHAIKLAMEEAINAPGFGLDKLFTMVNEWDETTRLMNQICELQESNSDIYSHLNEWLNGDFYLEDEIVKIKKELQEIDLLENLNSVVTTPKDALEKRLRSLIQMKTRFEFITPEEENDLRNKLRSVEVFRRAVLTNLIRIGIPITITSTGAPGLLWHPESFKENFVPLNFLPPFVEVNRFFITFADPNGNVKEVEIDKFYMILNNRKKVTFDSYQVTQGSGADKGRFYVTINNERMEVHPKKPKKLGDFKVQGGVTGRLQVVRLVKYNKKGKVRGLARAGGNLLTQLSGMRPA